MEPWSTETGWPNRRSGVGIANRYLPKPWPILDGDLSCRPLPLRSGSDPALPQNIADGASPKETRGGGHRLKRRARSSEALTREQAVEAYTRGAAFAEFAEADKGTLEMGKLADLALLSQDIFTVPLPELPKTESRLTVVGGKIVHEAK